MYDPPALSTGYNQQVASQVVNLLQAKTIHDRLHATDALAATANSHVLVHLTETSTAAPTLEKYKADLRDKLIAAQATKPEDDADEEAMQMWKTYVTEAEYRLTHADEQHQSSIAQRAFVARWNAMYLEWGDLVGAMATMIEGEAVQVFHARRKPKPAVYLPVPAPAPDLFRQAITRDMLMQAMGLPDHGQEVVISHTEIMRGIAALDRSIFAAAGQFPALFKEIFGDLEVYRDSYFQFLSLKKAEEQGRLDEALREKEMREGKSDMLQ